MSKQSYLLLLLAFLGLLSWTSSLAAQTTGGRYREAVFSDVDVQTNIVYGRARNYAFFGQGSDADLSLDFYEPQGDTASLRPLVLAFFGGAFIAGSKEAADMQAWCDSLARYGYACASVGYRLGYNPISGASVTRAGYRALQDARAAVRFLKEYHQTYRIDTNYIFILGNSAGAITALQTAYASDSDRPASTFGTNDFLGNDGLDLGCLDCSGNTYAHTVDIAGVIGLWGAVLSINGVDSNDRTPALMVHGTDDTVVPIDSANAFNNGIFPVLYGSRIIDERLQAVGTRSDLYVYEGLEHNFYYDGNTFPNAYWDTIFSFSHVFLCDLHPYCNQALNPPPLSLNLSAQPQTLKLWPNPGRELLNLAWPEAHSLRYRCLSLLGQTLAEGEFPAGQGQAQVSTQDWPAGQYLIQAWDEQGQSYQGLWIKRN